MAALVARDSKEKAQANKEESFGSVDGFQMIWVGIGRSNIWNPTSL